MKEQTYKNHRQYVFVWHVLTGLALIALIIGAVRNVLTSSEENLYSATLLLLVALIMVSIYWYARAFALKAQDRAIRAEENLRHFALTGKLIDSRITMSQVIALRFASDNEFPTLVSKAANEQLTAAQIKKQIKYWRSDLHRV
ncbi:MAG TPA: DUF6526 family protein [Chitinophagaceae bacterium]|nr:DUF6526 family protein [Chitinophagaceae bacterium]